MKKSLSILFVALLSAATCVAAAAAEPAILPKSFNGWQQDAATARSGADPVLADAAEAPVLKEYGFSDAELATYSREDRVMKVKAARFKDASGAFGAFTFYQQPQMQTEKIGDEGASNNLHILFYRGNVLVEVLLDRLTAMSAADLRAMANAIPTAHGNLAVPPGLPGYLPHRGFIGHTQRYIVGPLAMEHLGVPVPPALVDFEMNPELVMGQYRSSWGTGNLLLISYPTPRIAMDRLQAVQSASLPGGPFYFKRTGPILAIANGNIPQDEAQSLLASVNYDANVTQTQPTHENPKDNLGNLIVGVFVLIGFIGVLALILGFAFGGARVLAKKIFPNRVFDRPEDVEIIRLNLE
jgi:hypothetical protein